MSVIYAGTFGGKDMSQNDVIVLRANYDDWKNRTAGINVDPWLFYCVSQFAKPHMLDDEEILSSIVDGGNDGGVDAIFFIVNHKQLVDENTSLDPKTVLRVRLIFIQVKHSGGFKPNEIEKAIQTTDDFFDLAKSSDSFGTRYNAGVLRIMRTWKDQILRLSGNFPEEIHVDYYYVTGDDVVPDDYALDAGNRVIAKAQYHIRATCRYHFIGAQQLWERVQLRAPKSRMLAWSETPMVAKDGTVGLVKLKNYYDFLRDDEDQLAESIFESNVRGYQRDAGVNTQIRTSLTADPHTTNFWLLNNGVTIITAKASSVGHQKLEIQDPQIVNGLQTSREIFDHFSTDDRADDRSVLVRVIETNDASVRDLIIRATNSQNRMQPSQLRMTDQIHREIEEIFKKVGFYYDRRKGFYRDQGKAIAKIISVNTVTQAIISVLLQKPNDARARPGDYFKSDEKYRQVYGEGKYPLQIYVTCVQLMAAVENFLQRQNVERGDIKNLKFYVAAILTRELCQLAHPNALKIIQSIPDVTQIDEAVIESCYKHVLRPYIKLAEKLDRDTVARGTEMLKQLDRLSRRRLAKGKIKKKAQ